MALNDRSLKNLEGAHPDLVKVAHRADELTDLEFIVTECLRSMKRQRELVAAGASKTLKSRHLPGPDGKSRALDFVPVVFGEVCWKTPAFLPIIAAFKQASAELKIPIESGGDWKSFKDYPHIQLPWKEYP